jgi:hypothetical protein
LNTTLFSLPAELSDFFNVFKSPADVQAYLDATPYSPEDRNRCPVNVVKDRSRTVLMAAFLARWSSFPGLPPVDR